MGYGGLSEFRIIDVDSTGVRDLVNFSPQWSLYSTSTRYEVQSVNSPRARKHEHRKCNIRPSFWLCMTRRFPLKIFSYAGHKYPRNHVPLTQQLPNPVQVILNVYQANRGVVQQNPSSLPTLRSLNTNRCHSPISQHGLHRINLRHILPIHSSFSTLSSPLLSGHSRWSKIKHDKAKVDASKTQARSTLSREITIASKRTFFPYPFLCSAFTTTSSTTTTYDQLIPSSNSLLSKPRRPNQPRQIPQRPQGLHRSGHCPRPRPFPNRRISSTGHDRVRSFRFAWFPFGRGSRNSRVHGREQGEDQARCFIDLEAFRSEGRSGWVDV